MFELVLAGPGRNALSTAILESIPRRLAEASSEPVLLTGEGGAFSAGLNLKELAGLDPAGMRRLLHALEAAVKALFTHPVPTAAAVNGHAIAGGCVLALCCDVRVATADPAARIGLNEVALGLVYPPMALAVVRARLAPPALEEVVLGAGLHPPAEALRLGIAQALSADPRADARARLEALGRHPRAAYADAKAALASAALAEAAAREGAIELEILPAWTSQETAARVAAALRR